MIDPFSFVTRTDSALGISKKSQVQELSDAALHRLGIKGVNNINPRAHSPHLEPSGVKRPAVYVLTACPTPDDDSEGGHAAGDVGGPLRQAFQQMDGGVRYNCVVRTIPAKTKWPVESLTREHIECYRPDVVADIEASRPVAIVGCGKIPLAWMIGKDVANIWEARGRRIPVKVGEHVCWFYPVEDPVRIHVEQDDDKKAQEKVSGKGRRELFLRDLRRITREVEEGLPEPEVEETSTENLQSGITVFTGHEPNAVDKLRDVWHRLRKEKTLTHDTESTHLRPYYKDAKLLCIAIGTPDETVAFAVDHPGRGWSQSDMDVIRGIVLEFIFLPCTKVAHNLRHDLEWTTHYAMKLYGEDKKYAAMARALNPGPWHCTQVEAFHLDEREGGHNLNFLTAVNFGFTLKTETELDKANLATEPLGKVLMYCGMDCKYTARLHVKQRQRLREESLWDTYREFVKRVPSVVAAQIVGLPVDQKVVTELAAGYEEKITRYSKELRTLPDVVEYERKYKKKLVPSEPDSILHYYRDYLGRNELKRGNTWSTDEDSLKAVGDDASQLLLKIRKASKAKSTYIDPLDITSPDTVVFPDGRVHTIYNICRAATGRLSSEEPNMQNYPKRDPITKKVRAAFVPPEGMVFVSVDYAQIEARVFAMVSRDKNLIQSFWDATDTHMHWAKKIVAVWGKTIKARHGHEPDEKKQWKAFRNEVKNQFVFPIFFGSSLKSCARNLEMPEDVLRPVYDEFKEEFEGIITWQKNMEAAYKKTGYVENLLGRRRHGPLSWNQIINTPVQGLACDIMVNAWNRLRERAFRKDRWWLAPVMQIHDDLTFFVPSERVAEAVDVLVKEMCAVVFEFINVPVGIEVSVGPNWDKLEEVGRFASNIPYKGITYAA